MSVADIYGFEQVFEPPVAELFLDAGIIPWTSQGRMTDDGTVIAIDPKNGFQKDRPRVEIIFTRGAARNRPHQLNPGDPLEAYVESAWKGNLSICLVTDPNPKQHLGFLPQVRFVCAQFPISLNAVKLVNHCWHWPSQETGEVHSYNLKEGHFATFLNFTFDFSIQRYAWALLNKP